MLTTSKKVSIAVIIILLLGAGIGVWLGLRSRTAIQKESGEPIGFADTGEGGIYPELSLESERAYQAKWQNREEHARIIDSMFSFGSLHEVEEQEIFVYFVYPEMWGEMERKRQIMQDGTLHTIRFSKEPKIVITAYDGPVLSGDHPADTPLVFQGYSKENYVCYLNEWNTELKPCPEFFHTEPGGTATIVYTKLPWDTKERVYALINPIKRVPLSGFAVTYTPEGEQDRYFGELLLEEFLRYVALVYDFELEENY